jgi:hypothetical protein
VLRRKLVHFHAFISALALERVLKYSHASISFAVA